MVASAHLSSFEHILEKCVSGSDAIYWTDDQLGVDLDTDHDEFWFRMALLHETSIPEIRRVDDRSYVMNPRFLDEIHTKMNDGLFECSVVPLTVVYLELAQAAALCTMNAGLAAARSSFAGHPPDLLVV